MHVFFIITFTVMLFIDEPNTVYGNLCESHNKIRSICTDKIIMNKDNQKRQSRPPACQPVKAEVSADSQVNIGKSKGKKKSRSNIPLIPCNDFENWDRGTCGIGQPPSPEIFIIPQCSESPKMPKGKRKAPKEQPISVSASVKATIDNRPKNGCRPSNNVCQPCDDVCQPCEDVCRRDEHVNLQSRQFDNVLCSGTPYSVSGFESLNYDTCGLEQPPPEVFIVPQYYPKQHKGKRKGKGKVKAPKEPISVSASGKATIDFGKQHKRHNNSCQPCDIK